MKSVNDIMPMIGARFYTQLDAAQVKSDVLEGELSKVLGTDWAFKCPKVRVIVGEVTQVFRGRCGAVLTRLCLKYRV